jgi:hypothetical protein
VQKQESEPKTYLQDTKTFQSPWRLKRFLYATSLVFVEILTRGLGSPVLGWVIGLIILAPFLFGRPKRILISADEVTYLPSFGARQVYKFSEITSITQARVMEDGIVGGARFQFRDGNTAAIALEFYSDYDKVFGAITTAWRRYTDTHASGAEGSQAQEPH